MSYVDPIATYTWPGQVHFGFGAAEDGAAGITEYDLFLGSHVRPAPHQMPSMIAIPTIAGTGSTVSLSHEKS